ncbi:PREDICTED: LEAF RUST 10 DISEASE-RESISTANCE LOCUS RECEPTOR-LIKE PROTEIN KINASE-like 2.4 [Theobroma cacao]|uniref:LEAF RUST 10 DISEASE-RESISTANCE LOCUS RECEPTOR-LIKE PROTEIN KINASE-like 2.4 n=1 Tax=Theobroma cacao TaxID=3641 RepID=A0AB32VM51_THECC|nr:PREDICTED: LEAF RUST 10 DISEASE-RESISTANCE LOCUS RECEPTOR-LIKE PROTEIN KINASE-like 2.4 [Theobroma cacao]
MKNFSALFSLLIFLFINATEARKNPQLCSSSCGDIHDISYPFRLKEDPDGCGDPDFQLSCKNNKTILNFHGGFYYVKRISYDERTIRVADVNLANGSCGLPNRSLSIQEVQMDARYPGLVNYNYSYALNFVRCSNNISDLANSRVPCLSGNTSLVYVNITGYPLFSNDVPKSCEVISTVPAFYEITVKNLSYETALKMQESGFDMRWSVECRDCRAKGRGCVYETRDTTYLFKCEKEYDYEAELRLIYTYFVAMFLFAIIGTVRFILLPVVILAFILHKYFTMRKKIDVRENSSQDPHPSTPERYTYPDILAMSNNFKDKIGQGCFGSVYKGQLPGGCSIAVKIFGSSKLGEENFINEVSTISKIQHPNVVPFLGFCSEGSKYALVTQYMPNGSLDKYIFSNSHSFSWEKLHEIALGTAQGIEFLHGRSGACIVHFDIKPQNILLDQNFIPKIADFCLAKLYPKKHDFMSMCATSETIGYMAPELISRGLGAVSCKSDVYSFGMLLLELASKRRKVDVDAINSSKVHFPSWVYELNERGDLELENATKSDATIARKLLIIGLWCTQTKASQRPSMTRVVEMLRGKIDDLEMPPKPVFFSAQDKCMIEAQSDSPKEMLLPESMERSS